MDIFIGDLALTGLVPEEQVQGFRIVASSELQVSKPIQPSATTNGGGLQTDLAAPDGSTSSGVQLFDRGNYLHTVTFTITRVHRAGGAGSAGSSDAAENFLLTHLVAVEAAGVSTLKYKTSVGTYYLVPAFAGVAEAYTEGCSSFIKYKVTGGRISTTPGGTVGGGITAD